MLNVNITCTDTVNKSREHKSSKLSMLEIIGVGVIIAIIIGITLGLSVVFYKVYNRHDRHTISRQLYAYTLLKNKLPSIQPEHVHVNSDTSDTSQPLTTVTGSDFQQANSIDSNTSAHQQDNSSEDTYISELPKGEHYVIMHSEALVKSWMETTV